MTTSATAQTSDPDDAGPPPDIAVFLEQMNGCCRMLVAIGTPDALAAADAVGAAMDAMSDALRLSTAAMAAVTPTEH